MDHMNRGERPEETPHMSLTSLVTGAPELHNREKNNCLINIVGKAGVSHTTVGIDFYIMHKSQCKSWNSLTKTERTGTSGDVSGAKPKAQATEVEQVALHQSPKLFLAKGMMRKT